MTNRKDYEIAKANADTARAALTALEEVRSKILDLAISGEIESKDFETINALESQLSALYDRLNSSPAFGLPKSLADIHFSDIVEGV